MKAKRLLPLLLAALLPLAASADWTLSGTSGNVTMTDGTSTLNMTVKSTADRTLMLGRTGNTKSNAFPNNSQSYSGSFDLTQPILDGDGDEWTIVEVAPYAFYNNKAVSGTIYIPAVTNIGEAAFGYATGLTGFTLGNKLEKVGASAFNSTFGNLSFTPSLPPSLKNVVTGSAGHPEAVLVRGVEGAVGPGRVTKAMQITCGLNREHLVSSERLWIESDGAPPPRIKSSPRVGIGYASKRDQARKWRFIARESAAPARHPAAASRRYRNIDM